MSDPHIRAALEAAAGAVFDAKVRDASVTVEQVAAAAIAAFLRALPDGDIFEPAWPADNGSRPDQECRYTTHSLAAAAEQEATRDG